MPVFREDDVCAMRKRDPSSPRSLGMTTEDKAESGEAQPKVAVPVAGKIKGAQSGVTVPLERVAGPQMIFVRFR